jgi:hypothetical protein
MKSISRRAIQQSRKKAQQKTSRWIYIALGLIAVLAIVLVVISANPSSANTTIGAGLMGDAVPILSRDHVPNNAPPPAYNSNPPAGGAHFADPLPAKFYTDSDVASLPKWPEGYLVHSLEHGYVIFWYNCQAQGVNCSDLKKTIQEVMNKNGTTKLIAFPWTTMDVPLAMTSWGRNLKFKSIDANLMNQFVVNNRYQAPEPDAQ